MSINLHLRRADAATIDRLFDDPKKIESFLLEIEPEQLKRLKANPEELRDFFMARSGMRSGPGKIEPEQLERLKANPLALEDFFMAQSGRKKSAEKQLDLGKTFDALHFLLTGSAEPIDTPASLLLLAGQPIGDVDVGYGPATAATPAEVAALASFLDEQPQSALRQRFESREMAKSKVYIGDALQRDGEEGLNELLEDAEALRVFVGQARAAGDGLVIWAD